MTDERAVDSARRAAETFSVASKDPGKGHFYVSVVKSFLRMVAGIIMISVGGPVAVAGGFLIIAEVLGVVEEIV